MRKFSKSNTFVKILLSTVFLIGKLSFVHGQNQTESSYASGLYDGKPIYYLAYLPDNHRSNKYSLVVYLHGIGERGLGNQLHLLKRNGLPKLIEDGQEFPFIVISPQNPKDFIGDWTPDLIDELLHHIRSKYQVDERRIYLTGFSLGGGGVWRYAMKYPNKVSAIIPIAGTGTDPDRACNLKNLPVWAFHGTSDPVVSYQSSVDMVDAINKCGGNAKLTSFENVKHFSWRRAYKNPDIYTWLLQHSRQPSKVSSTNINEKVPSEPQFVEGLTELAKLPKSLTETSGLSVSDQNLIWSHNDSNGLPFIIGIDTLGAIQAFKRVTNAANFDWEDLTRDKEGNLYIGDFGNNLNTRKTLQIYKIPDPSGDDSDRISAEKIEFKFPDQFDFPPPDSEKNYDIEAMIYLRDSLYLFTKNRTLPFDGISKVYQVPSTPGSYTALLTDRLQLEAGHMLSDWVTAAAISPDEKNLLLLSHEKITILSCFEGSKFSSGNMRVLHFGHFTQKEALSFYSDHQVYITDEVIAGQIGGRLYSFDLEQWLSECN